MKYIENIKYIALASVMAVPAFVASAQGVETPEETKYRRSSLCSFMINRTDQKMYSDIQEKFLEIPTPDQYNNHDLSIRLLNVDKKGKYESDIDAWLEDNQIASRLVAKWYNRNILTGAMDMDLVADRGLYDATEMYKELAAHSVRGENMLKTAGEELIGQTFVLVHEAHYIDNEKRGKNVGMALKIGGAIAGGFLGSSVGNAISSLGDMAATFKGFRVKIHSRLYRLDWNEETSNNFYTIAWDKPGEVFDSMRDKFHLTYIGQVESSGSKNSFMGINEENPEIMIRKACQRAIDDNVRDLQRDYEIFRVKSPIKSVNGNEVCVEIGMKEGVNEKSEYEILEQEEKNGRIVYKKVGTLSPVKEKIWDNRFMAKEEGAVGSELAATTFKVNSGKDIYAGMLVRQVK